MQLLAFVFVSLTFAFGVVRVEGLADRVEGDRRATQFELCALANENRAVLLDLVRVATSNGSSGPRSIALREQAEETLQPADCSAVVDDPSRVPGGN